MSNKADAVKRHLPKLRFPEFQDAPEWEIKPLGSLGNFVRGFTYTRSDVSEDGILVLRSSNIQDGSLILDKDLVFVRKNCPDHLLLQKGDVVICMANGSKSLVGKNAEYNGNYQKKLTVGAFCSLFRPRTPIAKFIFQTDQYVDFVSLSIGGGNINNLQNSALEIFPSAIPVDLPEQQKIADCLTSLDDLLTAQGQKLEALKSHKKGLMQGLFPATGESVPSLRFPEFQDAGEWEEQKLDEIASFYKGKGISKADIDSQGETPCIRYGELYTTYGEIIKTVFSKTNLPVSELFLSQKNDVIIPSSGETKLDIAKASCVLLDNVALGGDLNILRSNQNGVFLSYLINGPYKREIAKKAQGDAVVHLYANQLKLIKVVFPKKAEQQKIADCLSSLDEQIAAQSQKLEALKIHKKGLMQRLFSSAEEAQG